MGTTKGSGSKSNTSESGGVVTISDVVSGKGDTSHHQRRRRRLLHVLVKIGLAVAISYQTVWAANQLFTLTVVVTGDIEDDASKNKSLNQTSSLSSSSSSYAMKQSTFKSLPSNTSPNAELQALVNPFSTMTNNHNTDAYYSCPDGLIYVSDHIIALPQESTINNRQSSSSTSSSSNNNNRRLIPNILHFTTKSRCMTSAFAANIQLWKDRLGSQYSIYIHDDDAVDEFIYQRIWTEFPELKEVMACVTAGVREFSLSDETYDILPIYVIFFSLNQLSSFHTLLFLYFFH